MDLFLRLVLVLLRAAFAKQRITLEEAARLTFRLGRSDLSGQGLKQARYSSFADLGVVHFLARSGVLSVVRKKGWAPLLAAREVEVLAPVPGKGPLIVETRLLGWDERYTCFEHRMCVEGVEIARVRSIGRLAAKGSKSPLIAKMLAALGRNPEEMRPA
ncbi:MAG: thioesterase family protein, partial [Pseudomonadota bacterium]